MADFLEVDKWEGLVADETGDTFTNTTKPDRTLQVNGTWGGATLIFEGCNDNANFLTLLDIEGNALSFTAIPTQLYLLREAPAYLRARVSGGDGTTSLNVYLSHT